MKKIAILTNLMIVLFTSCEKEINLEISNNSPKLVIEGNIVYGLDTLIDVQQIRITRSVNYIGSNLPEPITNAQVTVTEGTNTFVFDHDTDGIYKCNFIAGLNKTYKLIIIHDGDTYEATETIKDGPLIDSISISYFPSAFGSPDGYFATINTKDPINTENFYLWRLFINGQLMINPSPGNSFRAIQKDEFFNGQPLLNYLPYDNFPVINGDTVRMEQLNISREMYNYYYSIFNLTASESLSGDSPPGKIYGNVKNISTPSRMALGYFGACSISIKYKNI